KIVASASSKSTISYVGVNASNKAPSGIVGFAVAKDLGNSLTMTGSVFDAGADADTETSSCTIDTTVSDGSDCVSCDANLTYITVENFKSAFLSESDPTAAGVTAT